MCLDLETHASQAHLVRLDFVLACLLTVVDNALVTNRLGLGAGAADFARGLHLSDGSSGWSGGLWHRCGCCCVWWLREHGMAATSEPTLSRVARLGARGCSRFSDRLRSYSISLVEM